MTTTDEPPVDLDFDPVDELDGAELVDQHHDLAELIFDSYAPHIHDWHEDVHSRSLAIWQEIRRRSETTEPECPECGENSWGQSAGDPVHCTECGAEGPPRIEEDVHDAWEQMTAEVRRSE